MEFKDLQGKEKEQVEIKQPESSISVENSAQELAEMFEIEKADYGKLSPKINTLLDWAKQNTPQGEDIRWTLRRLETKLGTPPMGVDKISHMAEYAYLWLQSRDLNKKLDNYTLNTL